MSKLSRQRNRIELSMYAEIKAVYASLPTIECKGLCYGACTEIMVSAAEEYRLARLSGKPYEFNRKAKEVMYGNRKPVPCPHLSPGNRCQVYAIRPLVCRLYGVADGLLCPHGCIPSRVISKPEARTLITQMASVGGKVLPILTQSPAGESE